jgi:choline-sulfatase
MNVLSHMTVRWQEAGLWGKYRKDLRDRFQTKPYIARPSALPLEQYADSYIGEKANDYLANYDRREPWFCWVSFSGPHEPWDAPEPYASMHDPAGAPKAIPKWREATGPRPRGYLDKLLRRAETPSAEDIASMRANYAGNVTLIDDKVGVIIATLERRGELDNTIIVLTSDHGEMNGDHGLIHKSNFLDSAVRVPLIVRLPDATGKSSFAGSIDASLIELFDVGPTLLELVGAAPFEHGFSRSFVDLLAGTDKAHREYVISEHRGEFMYCDERWKLAVNSNGEAYLLFDRSADPDELVNLVSDAALGGVMDKLRLRIFEHLVQTSLPLE